MSSVRFYALVYVALLALATLKVVFFEVEAISYDMALALTMLAAVGKTSLIAGYFMHLRSEPRSVSYIMLSGLFAVLLVTFAAAFSIL